MRIDVIRNHSQGTSRVALVAVLAVLTLWGIGPALGHVGSPQLADDCGGCHVGHGKPGEPMLAKSEEDFCFQCHGSEQERSRMIADGWLMPSARLLDMRPEFDKQYSHPVDREGLHSPTEKLPSVGGAEVSHAECVDCHNPHQRLEAGKKVDFAVSGYSISGQYLERSLYEYEICLKCHSDRMGIKNTERSLDRVFALSVRSQHPVTVQPSGKTIPSLMGKAMDRQRMKCSDCHRSGDPEGPKGPHGSDNEFMLSGNYNRDVFVQESAYAFEFCYSCHDRLSILGNESFPYHREHIEGDPFSGRQGTSCFTCHASHGSPDNTNLIQFNLQAVTGEKMSRRVEYLETGSGSGTCVLECHGYNHAPGGY
ncbi:MAG: cytochrome c3 family protein [Candidatus Krumholzibacteriota bacterium]